MSEIFRKKSLDRVNSPDDLNEYMRVTNPPIWFSLILVILILAGAVFWGLTAELETKVDAVAIKGEDAAICYIDSEYIANIDTNTIVRIGNKEYGISSVGKEVALPTENLSEYEMSLANFKNGENVYEVFLEGEIANSSAKAEVVLEKISPISFIFGSVK